MVSWIIGSSQISTTMWKRCAYMRSLVWLHGKQCISLPLDFGFGQMSSFGEWDVAGSVMSKSLKYSFITAFPAYVPVATTRGACLGQFFQYWLWVGCTHERCHNSPLGLLPEADLPQLTHKPSAWSRQTWTWSLESKLAPAKVLLIRRPMRKGSHWLWDGNGWPTDVEVTTIIHKRGDRN